MPVWVSSGTLQPLWVSSGGAAAAVGELREVHRSPGVTGRVLMEEPCAGGE